MSRHLTVDELWEDDVNRAFDLAVESLTRKCKSFHKNQQADCRELKEAVSQGIERFTNALNHQFEKNLGPKHNFKGSDKSIMDYKGK